MPNLKTLALTALTFALTGPLFGTLALAVWGFSQDPESVEMPAALLGLVWMLPFGYLLGLAPAALTGTVAGLVRDRLSLPLFVAASAAIGLGVTWGLSTATATGPDLSGGTTNLALIGGLAGGLCGLFSGWLRPRRAAQPSYFDPSDGDPS